MGSSISFFKSDCLSLLFITACLAGVAVLISACILSFKKGIYSPWSIKNCFSFKLFNSSCSLKPSTLLDIVFCTIISIILLDGRFFPGFLALNISITFDLTAFIKSGSSFNSCIFLPSIGSSKIIPPSVIPAVGTFFLPASI